MTHRGRVIGRFYGCDPPKAGQLASLIKFVSDFRQVVGFLWVLWFPPPIKLTATI
jgi:hypothetical protein